MLDREAADGPCSGCEIQAGVTLPPAPFWCNCPSLVRSSPPIPAVRGTSVCGPEWPSSLLASGSDNDGSLFVSAYRGIGSETVRRPVVIAGRDPDKAMAGSWLHTGKPLAKFPRLSPRMLPAVSPPGN